MAIESESIAVLHEVAHSRLVPIMSKDAPVPYRVMRGFLALQMTNWGQAVSALEGIAFSMMNDMYLRLMPNENPCVPMIG